MNPLIKAAAGMCLREMAVVGINNLPTFVPGKTRLPRPTVHIPLHNTHYSPEIEASVTPSSHLFRAQAQVRAMVYEKVRLAQHGESFDIKAMGEALYDEANRLVGLERPDIAGPIYMGAAIFSSLSMTEEKRARGGAWPVTLMRLKCADDYMRYGNNHPLMSVFRELEVQVVAAAAHREGFASPSKKAMFQERIYPAGLAWRTTMSESLLCNDEFAFWFSAFRSSLYFLWAQDVDLLLDVCNTIQRGGAFFQSAEKKSSETGVAFIKSLRSALKRDYIYPSS